MTDMSDIDPIVTDVILEEEEVSNLPTESEIDGASISASQVGPTDVMPRSTPSPTPLQNRPSSALTVENLRLHQQTVALDDNSLSRQGSANSGQRDRPVSRGSLGPVRTPGSGTPVRLCSGKSGIGNITDGTTPVPDDIRTGSGKREPLPPIGSDPIAVQQNEDGVHLSRLSVSRENQDDQETVTSLRMSARSDRSVSFKDGAERPNSTVSNGKRKKDIKSPAFREVHKVIEADGSERVSISCATETEWSWLQMIKFLGKTEEELSAIGGTLNQTVPTEHPTKLALSASSRMSNSERLQSREGGRHVEESMNEVAETHGEGEEEIPPLQLDSDSEFSDEEDFSKSDQGIPKIGPPQIIKYQRESEQVPISQKYKDAASIVGQELDFDFNDFDSTDLSEKDDEELEARIRGRKKYEDYDDYDYDDPRDKLGVKASRSKHLGDDLDDRVTPSLSTVGEVAEVCEYCGKEAKPFPTHEMLKSMSQSELFCCKENQDLVEYTMENTALSQYPSEEMIDIAPHAPYGSKQARRAAKERAAQRIRDREMARQRAAGTNQANFYASHRIEIMDGVARQMKTINYSLSSQKCLDEGWTMRPPTPELEEDTKPVYVPEPATPYLPIILKSKKKGRKETPIVRKHYRTGELFMVMFEDGTGAVFYPSGSLAILITLVEKNQFAYYVQADTKPGAEAKFLAVFEPNGNGTCYHGNGNIRLNINQFGGVFTNSQGSIKKRWSWKDEDTHTKTPPFQPLCFSLNQQISIRCMMQEQIFISFNCDLQTCRFNAGTKLKLVGPDQVPLKAIDRDMLYISEVKTYVQMILDQIFNQKTFSKSPKLENLRPPLKIQNNVRKNERLKQKVVERKVGKRSGGVVTVK